MVECVYHLIPVLREPSFDEDHTAAVSSLRTAHNIVASLSQRLNVARHATVALEQAMTRWGGDSAVRHLSSDDGRMAKAPEATTRSSGGILTLHGNAENATQPPDVAGTALQWRDMGDANLPQADFGENVFNQGQRPNDHLLEHPYVAIPGGDFDTDADLGISGWSLELMNEAGGLSQGWMDREL